MARTKITLIIIGILAIQSLHAYGNDGNTPRAGDRLTFHRLKSAPAWTDSAQLSPDLSSAAVTGSALLQVFPPSPADTLSALCITFARVVMNAGEHDGKLCHISEYTPGDSRKYRIPYPLNFAMESGKVYPAVSDGLITEGDRYATSGIVTGNVTYGLAVTIEPEKTIRNVRCVESVAVDTFTFSRTEPFVHTGTVREWYAPGYRYPLLRMQHDAIATLSGEPVDSVSSWYMTDPDGQEESITDDPVNEAVRYAIRESGRSRFIPGGTDPGDNGGDPGAVKVTDRGGSIAVSSPSGSGGITEILLCDISGKVYDYRSFPDGAPEVTVTKERLLPGLYLLHISSGTDTSVYKFNI